MGVIALVVVIGAALWITYRLERMDTKVGFFRERRK